MISTKTQLGIDCFSLEKCLKNWSNMFQNNRCPFFSFVILFPKPIELKWAVNMKKNCYHPILAKFLSASRKVQILRNYLWTNEIPTTRKIVAVNRFQPLGQINVPFPSQARAPQCPCSGQWRGPSRVQAWRTEWHRVFQRRSQESGSGRGRKR